MSTVVSPGVRAKRRATNSCRLGDGVAWPLLQMWHVLLSARLLFRKLPVKAQAHGLLIDMHTASCSRLVPYITSWTPVSCRARIILKQDQPDASSHRNQKGCRLPCQRLSEALTGLLRRVAIETCQPNWLPRHIMKCDHTNAAPWLQGQKHRKTSRSHGSSMRMRSRLTD